MLTKQVLKYLYNRCNDRAITPGTETLIYLIYDLLTSLSDTQDSNITYERHPPLHLANHAAPKLPK